MIQRYINQPGVHTVVLSWDDYEHSPLAKGPTQAKRKNRTAVPEWQDHRPLSAAIPANYSQLLFNRSFKRAVVRYMIQQVTFQCRVIRPDQRIIIDHQGAPYVAVGYGSGKAAGELGENSIAVPATEFEVACPLGESDLKFVRYLPWGDMILEAIDSDYVVIGCAQIERLGYAAPRIFVRRLLLEPSNAVLTAVGGSSVKSGSGKGTKRPLDTFLLPSDANLDTNLDPDKGLQKGPDVATTTKKGRQYEFADCNLIVEGLRKTIGKHTTDAMKPYTVRLFTGYIALCGCDFTRFSRNPKS
jgi:hypothetical protein